MRVLLIEDDTLIANAMVRMFRLSYDAVVVNVNTIELAIGALCAANAGTPFDLVVSDWNIVDGNAGKVLVWARDNLPGMLSRWMFLSSDETAAESIIKEILADRNHGFGIPFVCKPATNAMIRDTVGLVLGRDSKRARES